MTMKPHDWSSTIALVTGANGGLGTAFIDELLRLGVQKIYAASRSATISHADERVVPITLDVTDPALVAAAARAASDVTLLINNAGLNTQSGAFAPDCADAAWREMEVNYFGILSMARAFAPGLIEHQGAMINVLSILARIALAPMATLCASKAAALRLTESLRAELGAKGVRVLALLPGAIDTAMSRHYPGEKLAPAEVVKAAFEGLVKDESEVYVGDMAQGVAAALATNRADVQAQFLAAATAT
ncbi:SDR family NAD(P)-dependent oxidoreductase [Burkholderia sp. Leaf177]|uniref:SDR family NAD(P)-dependent oxidoreductase n=1 Tax=Burkholderia sp. Leaf177 TaxID=1736287 RepID=UPI000B206389|nr:SDR family NAD(P)-dependent oxidoreductase [Burkholderia sp. Leaf177]